MHATNLGAQPPFTYLVQESYDAMAIVEQCRKANLPLLLYNGRGSQCKVLVEKKINKL